MSRPIASQAQLDTRFWSRVHRVDGAGCWEWQAAVYPTGYGRFFVALESVYAHRYAFARCVGEIPDGLFVCHHCDNKRCVRPDHLFLGTAKDNMQDCARKGRTSHTFERQTHCRDGHELSDANRGPQGCRICRRAFERAWRRSPAGKRRNERRQLRRRREVTHV